MNEVERFYDEAAEREWQRLERLPMEFAITMRALADFLPRPPATLLDIGGGPGRYAIAMGQQGYGVTLVDLARRNLQIAQEHAALADVALAGVVHASALNLQQFDPHAYDAVLLLGPLYHLFTRTEQLAAVREAARVLRPGGRLFANIITRYALIRWAAKEEPSWLLQHRDAAEDVLRTGVAVGDRAVSFTDAYYAHPHELRSLLEEEQLDVLAMVACEGVVSMIDERLRGLSGEAWQAWVDVNYRLGKDPAVQGAAEHVLAVGEKRVSRPHG
jgi:SAM-dependent methyltransferase